MRRMPLVVRHVAVALFANRKVRLPVLMILVPALTIPVVLATPAAATGTFCGGRRATIVGTTGNDVIRGTSGDDVVNGRGGGDRIYGGGGRDIICGGPGRDVLFGGPGDDRLYGNRDAYGVDEDGTFRLGDVLHGGSGSDRLSPGADTRSADPGRIALDSIRWSDAPRGVSIDLRTGVATGYGHDHFALTGAEVFGSAFGDRIYGSAAADTINGWRGSDTIYAGPGDDEIRADALAPGSTGTSDTVIGGYGNDRIYSFDGKDFISGGPGNDVLYAGGETGTDTVNGGDGDDLVAYGLGSSDPNGILTGGAGHDRLLVSTHFVNPNGAPATGTWNMGTGTLVFTVSEPITLQASTFEDGDFYNIGTWTIIGTPGDNTVTFDSFGFTGRANGSFDGLDGNDSFLGSVGDDTFNGGPGTDRSLGMGAGDDTCISVETFDVNDCEHIAG